MSEIPEFYDVTVLLPVCIRYWAESEQDARDQFRDTAIELTGPMQSFSVGFPESITVKEVVTAVEPLQ